MNDALAGTPCVLLVEDEILVRMFAADALEDAGVRVAQASNAAEATAHFEKPTCSFCAVVIDLGLPDRPGDELAASLRARHPELPILIASGRSEKELRERFAVDARVAIMVKPYTGPMLIEALQGLGVPITQV